MVDNPLSTIFGMVGIVYGLIAPLTIILLLIFFLLIGMRSAGAKARGVMQATYCIMMMSIGILLMTIAAIPTVASVLASMSYSGATYIAFLILFLTGGMLFLHHDRWLQAIDNASAQIPTMVYTYLFKLIGVLATLLSGLSLALTFIFGNVEDGWWVMPLTVLLYGLLVMWSTRSEQSPIQIVPPSLQGGKPKKRKKKKK